MGLAASQARFLCITARKADCEYKSTDLAQQKLELTNQLSDISTEYSNALNSTTLVWSNDAVDSDYNVSYGLFMTPSAANDYNPYMITTPAGAIVLNSEYAAAAKAAGISKGGGSGSQEQRDKFIQALVPSGIVTEDTANAVTVYDYSAVKNDDNTISFSNATSVSANTGIDWNAGAGLGREPLNKDGVNALSLSEMILSDTIGQKVIDWGQMFVTGDQITKLEYKAEVERLTELSKDANKYNINNEIIAQLTADKNAYIKANTEIADSTDYKNKVEEFETLIKNAKAVINGKTEDGYVLDANGNKTSTTADSVNKAVATQIAQDLSDYKVKYDYGESSDVVDADSSMGSFNFYKSDLIAQDNNKNTTKFTIVENGVINRYKDEIKEMTIGDLLSSNIVLMGYYTETGSKVDSANAMDFANTAETLLDYISSIFGYSEDKDLIGTGLNVDDESADALKFAYTMTKTMCLKTSDMVTSGSRNNTTSMVDNSAYQNAANNNKIGTSDDRKFYGISLSNLVSTFLTYYENALSGASSNYAVGTSVSTSIYVTDDSGYQYVMQASEDAVTEADERNADFFDEIYNNILEHGWREDASINDSEYLEAAIKDGRYSMSSLNSDGYYYQTRYNETGYMVEVSDTDAIARAEAEFTAKKAEITYKEDSIDLKTKQLDAEISSLSTEYDTVKSLISKNIEKIFAMFSS